MAMNRTDLAYVSHEGHLVGTVTAAGPLYLLSADLKDVMPGSVIQVSVSASAKGQFYYGPVELNGMAENLCSSWHVFTGNDQWIPLEASTLFVVPRGQSSRNLSFQLRLEKSDLSGHYDVYNLTVIARII